MRRFSKILVSNATKWLLSFAFLGVTMSSAYAINVEVTFNDPGGEYSSFHEAIAENMAGAAAAWGDTVASHPNATIDILVGFNDQPTASGGAGDYRFIETISGRNFFEPGIVSELKSGIDISPQIPDAEIDIGFSYLDILYFDPEPFERVDPVPGNRTDAVSTFIHELGHVFGFNGWRDWSSGEYYADAGSVFDTFVEEQQGLYYFTGPNAVTEYGGPVPLTVNNLYHVGNAAPRAGSDLLDDIMNGVQSYFGRREYISPLNVAMLADLGFEVNPIDRPACDLEGDLLCDAQDINELVAQVVSNSDDLSFDLNADGQVTLEDVDRWREIAGAENLPNGEPYPVGDINLDGRAAANDQFVWSVFNFSSTGTWTQGDFNADGVTDASDFNLWNESVERAQAHSVPEPVHRPVAMLVGLALLMRRRVGQAN